MAIASPLSGSSGLYCRRRCQSKNIRAEVHAHPRMPSTSFIPREVEATPIDCEGMTTPGAIVTVSLNSVPGSGCKDSKDGASAERCTKECGRAVRYELVNGCCEPVFTPVY